jgi:hypothetical protein
MKTGFTGGNGPRANRDISHIKEPLNLDFTLEEAVKVSLKSATWLDEADLGAATQAVLLAQTMDAHPERRHQIAPILIALLGNLGLLNNRTSEALTPQQMLAQIAQGA